MPDFNHLVNASVTFKATYPFIDMGTVIKVSIIGKIMHPLPGHGNVVLMKFREFFNFGRISENLCMTIHTNFSGGYTCHR